MKNSSGLACQSPLFSNAGLCSQLWFKLDIVPLVLRHVARARTAHDRGEVATFRGWERKALDEQADSMARKCIRYLGAVGG